MTAVTKTEPSVPVSVLVAGWNGVEGSTPFDAKLAAYGCEVTHMPHENVVHVPKCDIAILGLRSSNHSTTEKVRAAYRAFNRPVIVAPAGFEPIRARFEEVLAEVRKRKTPKVVVRKTGEGIPEAKALDAERRIAEREESVVLSAVKIDPAPTVESIVREGYAAKLPPEEIAVDLNRRGFRTPVKKRPWSRGTVSLVATELGCATKGRGKKGSVSTAAAAPRDELLAAILATSMSAETKIAYIERVHRGELTSLIDSGAKGDDTHIVLWRTPLTEPSSGIRMKLSKAEACLVVEHLEAIRQLAESEE